jgi:hypothetical protein
MFGGLLITLKIANLMTGPMLREKGVCQSRVLVYTATRNA